MCDKTEQTICGQSTAPFYLEPDSSTEGLTWCLPCRTAAVSILVAAFKRDQHLSISEPLPTNIEGAVASRLGLMTLSKQFRDVFMPRMRDLIKNESRRMAQKGGVVKTNNGWKLCDDLANDRVSQWMKVSMEGPLAVQSQAAVPQAAVHKPAPKMKQPIRGLGASRFAGPSPVVAAVPKISPHAAPQISTQAPCPQAPCHPPSAHSQPMPVFPTASVAVSIQQVRPQAERVEPPTGRYDVIQSSRLGQLDLEVEADYELIQQLVEKGNCGAQ